MLSDSRLVRSFLKSVGTYESCPILPIAHEGLFLRGVHVFLWERSELSIQLKHAESARTGCLNRVSYFRDVSHGTRSAFLARGLLILLKCLSALFVQPFNRFDPHSYKGGHVLTPIEECQVTGRNTHVEIPQAALVVCCNNCSKARDGYGTS